MGGRDAVDLVRIETLRLEATSEDAPQSTSSLPFAVALVSVAAGADLFVIECFAYSGELPGHITWDVLKPRLPDLRARRIMLTHMNPVMLAHLDEVRAAGALVAEDGAVIDL